jgi:hypothetical protein
MNRVLLRSIPILPGPELYDLLRDLKRSQDDIDVQVGEAADALRRSSQLVTTLEQNLKERVDKLERLRAEHAHYSQLSQIEAEKARALLEEVQASVSRGQAKERWIAFGINLVAGLLLFIVGVWLSDPVKHWLRIGP